LACSSSAGRRDRVASRTPACGSRTVGCASANARSIFGLRPRDRSFKIWTGEQFLYTAGSLDSRIPASLRIDSCPSVQNRKKVWRVRARSNSKQDHSIGSKLGTQNAASTERRKPTIPVTKKKTRSVSDCDFSCPSFSARLALSNREHPTLVPGKESETR